MNDIQKFVMRSLGSGKRRVKSLRRDMVNVTRCDYSESKKILESMHDSDAMPVRLQKRSKNENKVELWVKRTDI